MRISIIQSSLYWENPDANRAMFAEKLLTLRGNTDLVVLPEMFSTGFSMNAEALAEPMNGPTMDWLRDISQDLNAAITGSFICVEAGQYFNRLIFMRPDGIIQTAFSVSISFQSAWRNSPGRTKVKIKS